MKTFLKTLLALVLIPTSALAVNVNVQQPSGTYTDNGIPRRDGTGNLVQDSAVTVSDVASSNVTVSSTPGNSLTIQTADTNQSVNLLPNGTGNVGIGLANPSGQSRLLILDSAASTSPNLTTWNSGVGQIAAFSEITGGFSLNLAGSTAVRPLLVFKKARGTLAVPTAVADTDQLGQIIFQGYDGSASNFLGGNITSKVDGAVSSLTIPTSLIFSVGTSVANTLQTALTIRSTAATEFTPAQPASVATTPGTAAGNVFTVTLPTGGNTTIATTGTGGTGGAVLWTGGNGGTAALATTASTGGAGGLWRIAGGPGGASAVTGSGTGTGGKGGGIQLVTGNGGAVTVSTGVNIGGAGGDWTQTSGNGGNASAGSANTGGAGGAINITTGNGGTGATAAGNSGTLTLNTGTSGAGGTVGSILLKTGNTTAVTIDSSQNVNVNTGQIQTGGNRVGYSLTGYGAGTVYTFTNTAAAVALGTTSPTITIDKAGTYMIFSQVQMAYAGATVVAETATIKLRRTNNTPADLTSGSLVVDLPTSTVLTYTYGEVHLPTLIYTTANTNDIVTIFANVSANLGAGTITAEAGGTFIVAVRLF